MSVTLQRNPPADNSGGFMSVRFLQSGRISTIERFHVAPFGAGGAYTTPPGTEVNVAATFAGLVSHLQVLYNSAWLIQLTALTQRVGSALQRVAVPTAIGGAYLEHAGTSSTATTGIEGYVQQIFIPKTVGGRNGRIRLVGQGGVDVQGDAPQAADAAGTDLEKLWAYLIGSNTGIVAHDGTKLTTPIHTTFTTVARPRRLSMRVA